MGMLDGLEGELFPAVSFANEVRFGKEVSNLESLAKTELLLPEHVQDVFLQSLS